MKGIRKAIAALAVVGMMLGAVVSFGAIKATATGCGRAVQGLAERAGVGAGDQKLPY